jgi:hypothetical protein
MRVIRPRGLTRCRPAAPTPYLFPALTARWMVGGGSDRGPPVSTLQRWAQSLASGCLAILAFLRSSPNRQTRTIMATFQRCAAEVALRCQPRLPGCDGSEVMVVLRTMKLLQLWIQIHLRNREPETCPLERKSPTQ